MVAIVIPLYINCPGKLHSHTAKQPSLALFTISIGYQLFDQDVFIAMNKTWPIGLIGVDK